MKQLLMNRNEVFQRPSPKVLNTLKNFKAEHVNRYFDEIDGYYNSILIPKISKIFDIEDCIKQYQKFNPKVILIASPNNPTGNSLSVTELEKILKNTRVETLV